MKTNRNIHFSFLLVSILVCVNTFAQESKDTKETQEIIIRKKGNKDTKVTVEITGNSILVNGKPLAEFKEDGITINNRKMIIREGDKITMMLDENGMNMLENIEGPNFHFGGSDNEEMRIGSPYRQKRLRLGVKTETKENEGVQITEVLKESAAEVAGLLKDDIIYKVDDSKMASTQALSDYIKTKKNGDKIKIYFTRDGKKKDVTATLENKNVIGDVKVFKYKNQDCCPPSNNRANGNEDVKIFSYKNNETEEPFSPNVFLNGIEEGNIVEKINRKFGMQSTPKLGLKIQDTEDETGVKVINVEPESTSASAGLQKEDIIVSIGEKTIKNTDEARAALNENKGKSSYAMKVKRNGTDVNITNKIPKKLKIASL